MDIVEVNGMGNNTKRGLVRRRGMKVRTTVIQFSGRLASFISNYETNIEDDVENRDVDVNRIKHFIVVKLGQKTISSIIHSLGIYWERSNNVVFLLNDYHLAL